MSKDRIFIKGTAVKEGISRNNRKYIPEELEKFAPTMNGRPILKDHEGFTDNVIGKVTESKSIDGGKIVEYRGWIKEDGSGIIEKIKDGRISEVSIGAIAGRVVKEKKSDNFIIPIDMEALELSTTPTPGNRGTSIGFEKSKLSEKELKEIITKYEEQELKNKYREIQFKSEEENQNSQSLSNDNFNIENRKEDTMEETNTQSTNPVEKVNTEAIEKAEALSKELSEAKLALENLNKEKASVEEARRQDAINRYKEKAEAKELKVKDLSNSSMEMIQFAIEMADEAEEPKAEEPVEEPKEEPVVEEPKEEPKVEAEPKSEEAEEEPAEEKFEGYNLERAEGGYAFFKYY
ncbi:hypothetical protein KAI04_04800 [Candidatus Pacearchaeota archaeon]|nr:hypothetical protein [Candidatus Pacearchaeota archaeon]